MGIPVWRLPGNIENVEIFQLEGTTLIGENLQLGLGTSFNRREFDRPSGTRSATGAGDTRLTMAWEFLPELTYSRTKPNGFIYGQITAPTGKNIYESSALEATGRGFYQAASGAILLKQLNKWDAATAFGFRWGFEREFQTASGPLTVRPGLATEAMVAFGFSPSSLPWRFGASLSVNYNEPGLATESNSQSPIAAKQVWDTGIDATWNLASHSSLIFSYNDQTIWGPASNTSLMRTVLVRYSQRWDR